MLVEIVEFSLWVCNFEFAPSNPFPVEIRVRSNFPLLRLEVNGKCLENLGDISPFINDLFKTGVEDWVWI